MSSTPPPSSTHSFREKWPEWYAGMLRIRLFENAVSHLFTRGKVHGTAHFYVGQEAVAVGTCTVLRKGDFVTSTHRGHGHAIAKGLDASRLMAEIMGRSAGFCAGRGGTQHVASRSDGFLANGITGGLAPVGAGVALAYTLQKKDNVVVVFIGDGALNEGHFHEAINLAAVWKLPVLFVCENNIYAMSTHVREAYTFDDLSRRAAGYGIPGEIVDGNDVEAVYRTVQKYVDRARKGEGPALIECKTYRFSGHSKNDLFLYRTREEEAEWKKRDPIETLRVRMLREAVMDEAGLQTLEKKLEAEMEAAKEQALQSPEVGQDTVYDHL